MILDEIRVGDILRSVELPAWCAIGTGVETSIAVVVHITVTKRVRRRNSVVEIQLRYLSEHNFGEEQLIVDKKGNKLSYHSWEPYLCARE